MAPSGLESSIWATRGHFARHRYDMRSRSMPPEPQQQSSTTTTRTTTRTTTTAPTSTSAGPTVAPAETTATNAARGASAISPALAFHRFEQACQRLRWKYIDLESSYKRALSPEEWNFTAQDAERNFKIDFYEFYAWIEQTLVLALLVFGIAVSREKRIVNGHLDDARGGPKGFAAHSYHHNVLRALDEEDNPLHDALGAGDVNHALWKAKELRNRWKDAAQGRETPPLKMYDLAWIVTTILGGLEVAYHMALEKVKGADSVMENIGNSDEWEWMVEMDWEA